MREKRPERFAGVGRLPRPLRDEGLTTGEAEVGTWATEVWRRAAGARAFFAMAAGFRAGLPAGEVTREEFEGAFPYRNVLVTAEMTGRQLAEWVALSESKRGTDGYSQRSGVSYRVRGGRVEDLRVLRDAADPGAGEEPVRPEGRYRVATTDFQAFVAGGYKEALRGGERGAAHGAGHPGAAPGGAAGGEPPRPPDAEGARWGRRRVGNRACHSGLAGRRARCTRTFPRATPQERHTPWLGTSSSGRTRFSARRPNP
ncbi:5'-nucleotidase [Cystobacter fuscus]